MTNYLLSIDPSIKNTGFTLGEKNISKDGKKNQDNTPYEYGKPIFVKSYSFKIINKEYSKFYNFEQGIDDEVSDLNTDEFDNLDLIIERGTFHVKNGIGYETQEHLRGFIAGQFNKLLTKDMLICNTEGGAYYEENYKEILEILTHEIMNNFIKENNIKNININKKIYKKGIIYLKKELSFKLANYLKNIYNGEPIINNHDEADSLLMGGCYLNKENK